MSGHDNVSVKPLVKHVLSKELQLYFEKVCNAFLDEANEEYRVSAFSSLKEDPGLHQLVPYFVQFISEKVTHNMKDLFVLTQAMHMTEALIQNATLYVDPYVSSNHVIPFRSNSDGANICVLGCVFDTASFNVPYRAAAGNRGRHGRTLHTPRPRGVAYRDDREEILAFVTYAKTTTGAHVSKDVPRPRKTVRVTLRGAYRATLDRRAGCGSRTDRPQPLDVRGRAERSHGGRRRGAQSGGGEGGRGACVAHVDATGREHASCERVLGRGDREAQEPAGRDGGRVYGGQDTRGWTASACAGGLGEEPPGMIIIKIEIYEGHEGYICVSTRLLVA